MLKKKRREYNPEISAAINEKGVLDADSVKGCYFGIKNNPAGCYGACYAKKIADFRRINFADSVPRYATRPGAMRSVERLLAGYRLPFVRIGTMGDPSHDWPATLYLATALSLSGKQVVIVTKHWLTAAEEILAALGEISAIINTSISALDTPEQRDYRLGEYERYKRFGKSILRIVSCDFNPDHPEGRRLMEIQAGLFLNDRVIDNPLRVGPAYPPVKSGIIRLKKVKDLNKAVWMSKFNDATYTGKCSGCPELCGVNL